MLCGVRCYTTMSVGNDSGERSKLKSQSVERREYPVGLFDKMR